MLKTIRTEEEIAEYNKLYYEQNKEKISEQRKRRYWEDDRVREGIREKSRERYRKKVSYRDKHVGYTVKQAQDSDEKLFTISYAAKVAGKPEDTIRAWERQGVIPLTLYTDTRGWRLYTSHQIELLARAFSKLETGEWNKTIIRQYLGNHWGTK